MAFQAGGPHAQDRGLEAVAYAVAEMSRAPRETQWEKPQGKGEPIRLSKRFRIVPRGVAVEIGCATFPTWNLYPGLFASLATGNTAIVKPHPAAILPAAITIRILREVMREAGFDPNAALLAADEPARPITKDLVQHPAVRIVDFTGGPVFGSWLRQSLKDKLVYTEEAGVNAIVIDSTANFRGMCDNIAFSLSLYSGQMCTAPQNVFVPKSGVDTDEGHKSFDEVASGVAAAVDRLLGDPARAATVLGAIQGDATLKRVERIGRPRQGRAPVGPDRGNRAQRDPADPRGRRRRRGGLSRGAVRADLLHRRDRIDRRFARARRILDPRARRDHRGALHDERGGRRRRRGGVRPRQCGAVDQSHRQYLRQPVGGVLRLSRHRRQSGRKRLSDRRRLRRQPLPHRSRPADERVSPPMTADAFICDTVRTPIGRYGGALAGVRADDLAALPIRELLRRHPGLAPAVDEVFLGSANQAGEDNRNLARMALLLAGLPDSVPGVTVNRLCASGMDAVAAAARAIKSGEIELAVAGGSESMTRAPLVMGKAETAYQRSAEMFDTTIGWRFVNPRMKALYGVDSMPETAQNVADEHQVSREDQDAFALRSQRRTAAAQAKGTFDAEIVPVEIKDRKGAVVRVTKDEHPRADTTLEALAKLRGIVRPDGSVTAGNASGVNDGAAALILASRQAAEAHGLEPIARVLGYATAGVAPRVMGVGPITAVRKLCERLDLTPSSFDVIELNEAFASQALACLRGLGLADDDERVNPNGGAIALGHPLGMSGARIAGAAALELRRRGGRYGLATMCVGVGQGVAMAIERV